MTRPTEKACIAQRHLVRALGARPIAIAVASLLSTSGVFAQTLHTFSIPPGPLSTVLGHAAATAGVLLSVDARLTQGMDSPGVQGRFTAEDGLARALAGTGLMPVRRPDGGFTLRAIPVATTSPEGSGDASVAPDSPKEHSLSTVTVSGKAPGSTTEGTGSYTTFSTSSSTRLNLTPQETPQAISVLTSQRLHDQHLTTVASALEAAPGVVVQNTTIGQDGPAVYARGSYLQNYQIDGVPTSSTMSPFLENTASYDRIELVRGATGILNGLGTPAATVNLIRKRPTAETRRVITTEAGSRDRAGAGADFSGSLNESSSVRARLVADYNRGKAWVDRFKQENRSVYGVVEWDVSDKTLVTAGFSHFTSETQSPIMGRPIFFSNGQRIPLGLSENGTPDWNYYNHASTGMFASVEHYFASGWVGKIEYGRTRYRYDGVVNSILGSIDAATGNGAEISPANWVSQNTQDTVDAYLTGQYTAFGRRHELISGISLMRIKSTGPDYWLSDDFVSSANIYDWASSSVAPTFTNEGQSAARERLDSVYVSTRLSMSDATNLLVGTRLARWTEDRLNSSRRSEQVLVPYIGLVHALDDTWSLYGSYTKIFQPQTARTVRYSGQSSVDPEEGVGFELGVKASFLDGHVNASANVYESDVKNLAVWNPGSYRYEVQGKTKTRGVEFEVSGSLPGGWQISAGYATANSIDQDKQRTLGYIPRQTAKLFTTKRLAGSLSGLTLGGGVSWQGAMSGGGTLNYEQGSVALVNLMARYEASRSLSISMNIANALDKRYYSSVMSNYGTYGAPRSLILSAKYAF